MGKDSEGGAVTEQVGEEASAPAEKPSDAAAPEGGRAQAPAAPPPVPLRLFGTVEFRTPIKGLPKWERVRSAESGNPSFTAKGIETPNAKVLQRWTKLKEQFQNAPLREKMKAVNNFFNQWPYKFDMDLWGVEDYWATPREFVMKSGDCEDYAIAKYYALRDLGVPAGSMRIAAVKDNIRGLGHAILVVFVDNDAYILDNLTNLVLSHKRLSHYAPQYTVNEEYLWRHVKPKSTPGKQ
jgi:predicted transglutaminase-like cysteine proteinase